MAWWAFLTLCVLGLVYTGSGPLHHVAAQPSDASTDEELDDEDATTTTDSSDSSGKKKTTKGKTLLQTLFAGGWVGVLIVFLIFLLSLVSVGFIVEHCLSIRKSVLAPDHVVDELEEMIGRGQIDDAIDYCHQGHVVSLASGVILAGLERYKGSEFGFAEYKSAVEEEGEAQTARLYRKTEVLGLIGAIAPMLGLTGTVSGMITAFNVIAASEGTPEPAELAGGIGQALYTTLFGLIVAIPAMIAFTYFRNRIDSIVAEAGKRIERVMMPLGRQK